MNDEIYHRLRAHIDSMPAGFPETGTGAEISMLKKFYTEEQAKIALEFKRVPEKASAVALRLGMDESEAELKIEQMAKEGALFRMASPDGPLYMHPNFIMGLYEWHIKSIDKEAAEYADHIYEALFENHWRGRETKQLRVVPVHKSIEVKNIVRSFDVIRDLVKGKAGGPYAVAPCICRVEQKAKGNEVKRPMETCLTFGLMAKYYIENGIGREMNENELMNKLDECEEAGLIPFSTNSQEIGNMCMCDKDSCQMLRVITKWPKPAHEVHSAFMADIDSESCTGCGKCVKRCQVDAIKEIDAVSESKHKKFYVDPDRCFGCGLCVPVCSKSAVTLNGKDILPNVPETPTAMSMMLAQERAKLNK